MKVEGSKVSSVLVISRLKTKRLSELLHLWKSLLDFLTLMMGVSMVSIKKPEKFKPNRHNKFKSESRNRLSFGKVKCYF